MELVSYSNGIDGKFPFQIWVFWNELDRDSPIILREIDGISNVFREIVKNGAGGTLSTPLLVDLDADGDIDAVTGTFTGNIRFYKNLKAENGNIGTNDLANNVFELVNEADPFFGISDYVESLYGGRTNYYSLSFADVDADGDFDLFLCFSKAQVQLALITNCGSPEKAQFVGCNTTLISSDITSAGGTVKVIDIDNDGDFDLVVGERNGKFVFIPNLGNITYPDYQPLYRYDGAPPLWINECNHPQQTLMHCLIDKSGEFITADRYSNAAFLDFDVDGDYDMVSGNEFGEIFYFRNDGNASVPSFKMVDDSSSPFNLKKYWKQGGTLALNSFDFADLDGDGIAEIIMSCNYNGAGRWRLFKQQKGLCTKESQCSGVINCAVTTTGNCPCPIGYGGSKQCATCERGYSFLQDQIEPEYFDCLACSPGLFQNLDDSYTTTCEECGSGQYQPDPHAHRCILCPSGWYQKNGKQTFW